MNHRLAALLVLLFAGLVLASPVGAKPRGPGAKPGRGRPGRGKVRPATAQLLLGFGAEMDVDEYEYKGASVNGDDDDLEDNFGIMGTWDMPIDRGLRMGGRVALLQAEGDDSHIETLTVDVGPWLRYRLPVPSLQSWATAGAGLTYMSGEPEEGDDIEGWGWHLALGLMAEYPLQRVNLVGGLQYSYQRGSPEGDDVEYKDTVVTRVLLSAGVAF